MRTRKTKLFAYPIDGTADSVPLTQPVRHIELLLAEAGMGWTPLQLMSLVIVAGIATGLAGYWYTANLLMACALALIGGNLPLLYVLYKWRARQRRILGQVHEAFYVIAQRMRSGQTLAEALQTVCIHFEPPLAAEFAYFYELLCRQIKIEPRVLNALRRQDPAAAKARPAVKQPPKINGVDLSPCDYYSCIVAATPDCAE